jgi:uncharacterized surface protein with fasciclin (FAS1) repeats
MLSKTSFRVQTDVDKINIAKSSIQECDVTATNGVIHILDKVLLDEEYIIYHNISEHLNQCRKF